VAPVAILLSLDNLSPDTLDTYVQYCILDKKTLSDEGYRNGEVHSG
jgi:hypothetical protein